MKQTTENDANGTADQNNGGRLSASTEMNENAENRENFAFNNEELQEEQKEEEEDEEEKEDIAKSVYGRAESLIWGQELTEHERYEEEMYEERSLKDEEEVEEEEEGKSAPSSATIVAAAEKSEEEVRDVAGPDHVLAEIPVEIFASREEMIKKLRELTAEQAELQKRNRLLEARIVRDAKKTQEKVTPTYATKDPEQMEQIYRQTLLAYKLRRDDATERKERARADVQTYEDKVRAASAESARVFDQLQDREKQVATGLVYAKTGRKLTEKAVDVITRRQVSRREALARDRYEYTTLQQRLEEINTQLRSLETLGEGMTTMDYEALHIAHLSYKDKLEEREREVEKLRQRIAEVVNEIAHHKEKATCLTENIECEERELDEHHERTVRVRGNVNELHLILRDLRRTCDEKRRDAGLLMAQPVLHEMERTMKSMDALRSDIEIIKRKIQRHGPTHRGRKGSGEEEEAAASVMS